ncbi:hypothetical protein [Ktedonobacter racemifer]|uniref:Uncharacterized protein n=1 Tax=Ktedonobacter racemifer DSM 44963 TaxID=485913 RepID=D6U3Z6_KTERA|nr:hypothetical protein [Ktedonobacter racemifer]EFH81234.1 hypothetical protein Krac_1939 [Ktedonobacter racemifer DSM 44963]
MKRETSPQELHFIVANDDAHDFDLMQEAWIGNQMVAVIYRVGWEAAMEWRVSFYPQQKWGLELPWETYQMITQTFAAFREEMDQIPNDVSEEPSDQNV